MFEKVIFYFFSQNTRIDAGDYAQAWRSEVPHEHPADPPGGISGAGGVVGKAEIPGEAARRVGILAEWFFPIRKAKLRLFAKIWSVVRIPPVAKFLVN